MRLVVAHGGTTSSPRLRGGTRKAAQAGLAVLDQGPAAAVVEACRVLEDDPRFHAGTGGSLRLDGRTLEMDAGVSVGDGRFGAVAAIERVRNPILVAHALSAVPSNVVVGPAATAVARRLGMPDHDPITGAALRQWRKTVRKIGRGKAGPDENEWDEPTLRRLWNYDRPFGEVFPRGFPPPEPSESQGARPATDHEGSAWGPRGPAAARSGRKRRPPLAVPRAGSGDTVGAVATDGRTFAAAASTSGMTATLRGRMGDAVMLGCGILATADGAVACSGNGDHIMRERLATKVLGWMENGVPVRQAARQAVGLFPRDVDAAVIVLGRAGHAVEGNRSIAWSAARE